MNSKIVYENFCMHIAEEPMKSLTKEKDDSNLKKEKCYLLTEALEGGKLKSRITATLRWLYIKKTNINLDLK